MSTLLDCARLIFMLVILIIYFTIFFIYSIFINEEQDYKVMRSWVNWRVHWESFIQMSNTYQALLPSILSQLSLRQGNKIRKENMLIFHKFKDFVSQIQIHHYQLFISCAVLYPKSWPFFSFFFFKFLPFNLVICYK